MIAGILIARDKGEKMPHKIAVTKDKLMKSFGLYSYFGGSAVIIGCMKVLFISSINVTSRTVTIISHKECLADTKKR